MNEVTSIAGIDWQPEPEIFGEFAGYETAGGRGLDLVVTPLAAGGVLADVVDGMDVVVREWWPTVASAKAAAIAAARRINQEEAA